VREEEAKVEIELNAGCLVGLPGTLELERSVARLAIRGTKARDSREFHRLQEDGIIETIANAIVTGSWKPSPLRMVQLSKASGGVRSIAIASPADRVVDRAVAEVIDRAIDPVLSPRTFAYRRGLGVDDAIDTLLGDRSEGLECVVRSDIRSCFESIPKDRLLEVVSDYVTPELCELIWRLLERGDRPAHGPVTGIPQGLSISPILANLYLSSIDVAMVGAGQRSIRFADDFAVSVEAPRDAETALQALDDATRGVGLRLNRKKTTTATYDSGVHFLGRTLTKLTPPPDVELSDSSRGRVLYVAEQGAGVRVRNHHLVVQHGDRTLLDVPKRQVSSMVLVGSVGLTAQARSYALATSMPVSFLSRRGRWLGKLDSASVTDAARRRKQFECSEDEPTRLRFGVASVAAKIANQRALLLRYQRREQGEKVVGATASLEKSRQRALGAKSLDSLRGIEGAAARRYFVGMRSCIPAGLGFQKRRAYPPTDPTNSLLSLGYSLLLGIVLTDLQIAGLDPACGLVHHDGGRPSLACDLMEEFRPLLVDAIVVSSLRRRMFKRSSFERESSGRMTLRQAPLRRYLELFEERLQTRVAHLPSGTKTSYRRCISLQVDSLVAFIERGESYTPMPWR
jgi:CRISPR-associated protein Cas1